MDDFEIHDLRNGSGSQESKTEDIGISDKALLIYQWIVYSVLCQFINIFGIATNIINIICFVKQGFKDAVNISLLGLAVSDLGSLLTMLWTCICLMPPILTEDLPFDPLEVTYLTSGMAHFSFTRVSSCITAMIIMERCLCITAPLKINMIVTSERTAVVTICVFIIVFFSASPVYAVNKLDVKFSTLRNKTLVGLVFKENRENVEKISFAINNFAIPFGSFAIIVTCTIILSYKLYTISNWRQKNFANPQADKVSTRNQKVATMVVMISLVYIICFVPMSIHMLSVAFLPALSVQGKYMKIGILSGGIGCTMESINSSMNILIYYRMSSKYKVYFFRMCCRGKVKD